MLQLNSRPLLCAESNKEVLIKNYNNVSFIFKNRRHISILCIVGDDWGR